MKLGEYVFVCVRAERMARYGGYYAPVPAQFPDDNKTVDGHISLDYASYATSRVRINNFTDHSIMYSTQ